jgi:hypothetical protein
VADNEPTSLSDAIELALSILQPFRESSLYDDYRATDGWTDEQFQAAIDALTAAVGRDGLAAQQYFVVERTDSTLGSDSQ